MQIGNKCYFVEMVVGAVPSGKGHCNLTINWKNNSFIHSTASCEACSLQVLPLLPKCLEMTDVVIKTLQPTHKLHWSTWSSANKCKYPLQWGPKVWEH